MLLIVSYGKVGEGDPMVISIAVCSIAIRESWYELGMNVLERHSRVDTSISVLRVD